MMLIKKRIISMLFGYIMGLLILFPSVIMYEYITEDSTWVSIDTLKAESNFNEIGEIIFFDIKIDVKREVHSLRWRHVLRCRDLGTEGDFIQHSVYEGQAYDVEPRIIETTFPYLINGAFRVTEQPTTPTECYLDGNIYIETPIIKRIKSSESDSPIFVLK